MTLERIVRPAGPYSLALCIRHANDATRHVRDGSLTTTLRIGDRVELVLGTLEDKVAESERLSGEKFPAELLLRLKHIIVSHHGEYEYGSPKLPMTLEAIALHLLDNLDAKLYSVAQIMKEDAGGDSAWTSYNQSLGRKFFKGRGSAERAARNGE